MINVFCGYDEREAIGFHVFVHSLIEHTSRPVAITPLAAMEMQEGSNAFTLSRFLIPELMAYKGRAIFVDACDMLMQADIAMLDALFDPRFAVQVVKHPAYKTRHKTKYRGTSMECPNINYERKNWASVMLLNCAHAAWSLDVRDCAPQDLLTFKFLTDEEIGELPAHWNRLVDEGHPVEGAKILHWTAGMPAFAAYRDAPGANEWHTARRDIAWMADL